MSGLSRQLGAFEHFIWSTDQYSPCHFAYVVRITGPLTANALRRGLAAVQARHPLLRSAIVMRENGPWFVPTPLRIPLRVDSRLNAEAWLSEVAQELADPFSPGTAPLIRVVFLRGSKTSELIFTVHHSIGDGLSTLYFVRDLLLAISGETLEQLPLPPPADRFVLNDAPCSGPEVTKCVEALPKPGTPIITTAELEADTLQVLIKRSRAEGTTVHATFTAALLFSAQSEFESEEPISALQPLSLRSLNSQMGENFALYISAGIASLQEGVGLDLWGVARSIKKQLEPALDPNNLSARYSALRSFLSSNPNPSQVYSHYRRGVTHQLVVSNKGRLPFESQIGRLRIDAIWSVPNVEIEPFVSLLTIEDRMFITTVAERPMRKLLDCTLMRIREALGPPPHRRAPIFGGSNSSGFSVTVHHKRALGGNLC